MKILKIFSKLALVASAILIVISLIVAATSEYLLDAAFYTLFHTEILAVIGFSIGVFLMFTKNDITKKIGYGLTAVLMLFALINGTVVAKDRINGPRAIYKATKFTGSHQKINLCDKIQ